MAQDSHDHATHASDAPPTRLGRGRLTPAQRRWMYFFSAIVFMAGLAFCVKLYQFFVDLGSQEGFRFAGAHLATYLLVAGGFFLLLTYGFLCGHFSNIEQPKFDILDSERRNDRAEYGS